MRKKIFKISTVILLIFLLGIISVYLLQTTLLKKSLENKWLTAKETEFKGYEFVRCNWNILKPEVAFVDDYILLGDIKGLEVHFYTQTNLFDFSRESWSDSNYTGGTDIKNITFPELVKMVKKDCSQFQYGYDNPDPEGSRWTYKAYVEKPASKPMTDTEIRAEQVLGDFSKLPEEQQLKIRQNYGEYLGLTPQEVVDWEAQITRDINDGKFSLDRL